MRSNVANLRQFRDLKIKEMSGAYHIVADLDEVWGVFTKQGGVSSNVPDDEKEGITNAFTKLAVTISDYVGAGNMIIKNGETKDLHTRLHQHNTNHFRDIQSAVVTVYPTPGGLGGYMQYLFNTAANLWKSSLHLHGEDWFIIHRSNKNNYSHMLHEIYVDSDYEVGIPAERMNEKLMKDVEIYQPDGVRPRSATPAKHRSYPQPLRTIRRRKPQSVPIFIPVTPPVAVRDPLVDVPPSPSAKVYKSRRHS